MLFANERAWSRGKMIRDFKQFIDSVANDKIHLALIIPKYKDFFICT